MFEKFHQPIAPIGRFVKRMGLAFTFGIVVIAIALLIGMLGYHYFEGMSFVDSFLNAAMILSTMGPAATLTTTGGKIFAGFYALFSGLMFITIVGIVFGPIAHRFLHHWHVE